MFHENRLINLQSKPPRQQSNPENSNLELNSKKKEHIKTLSEKYWTRKVKTVWQQKWNKEVLRRIQDSKLTGEKYKAPKKDRRGNYESIDIVVQFSIKERMIKESYPTILNAYATNLKALGINAKITRKMLPDLIHNINPSELGGTIPMAIHNMKKENIELKMPNQTGEEINKLLYGLPYKDYRETLKRNNGDVNKTNQKFWTEENPISKRLERMPRIKEDFEIEFTQ